MAIKFDSFGLIQGSVVATFFNSETSQYFYTPTEDFGAILNAGAFTHDVNGFFLSEAGVEAKGEYNGFTRLLFKP